MVPVTPLYGHACPACCYRIWNIATAFTTVFITIAHLDKVEGSVSGIHQHLSKKHKEVELSSPRVVLPGVVHNTFQKAAENPGVG